MVDVVRMGDQDLGTVRSQLATSGMLRPRWDSLANMCQMIDDDAYHPLVAINPDGRIVGSVLTSPYGSHLAMLWRLHVVSDRRRQGVGRALLDAACDRLAANGATEVALTVRSDDHGTQAFYARNGFAIGRNDYRYMWRHS